MAATSTAAPDLVPPHTGRAPERPRMRPAGVSFNVVIYIKCPPVAGPPCHSCLDGAVSSETSA